MKLVDDDPQEVRARSLLLLLREVREDPNQAEKLIRQLREAEGESGLLWRVHQASFWLSSDGWRKKQQDIAERLQYCMDADPLWLPPVLLLVNMYERLGDFKRVEDICRRTLARNPSAAAIADRLLRLLESQERFSEAEQVLQQVQADTRLTSAWQVRAAVGAGDLSRAIDELKLKISDGDQDALSRIQLAQLIYQETKDADEAFRYLKEAESITSDSMALMRAKVSILKADGQTEKARQILDDYVADHNDFNAYWMRAIFLAEAGESERAEQDYQRLTTFAEQATAGYILLSNFYATNEKLDKAVKTLEEGLNEYPEHLGLMRNKMQLLFRRNQDEDREKALEILTALEEELPQDVGLMQLRAMQLLQEQDPQSRQTAKEKLETVVELAPKTVDAHLLLIGMAMEEGDFRNAREDVIRAIGSNPNNPRLLSARSRIELGLENPQLAIHLAQQALEEDPNSIASMIVLADAYRLTNAMDQSEQWIERAERLDPNNQAVFEARYLWLGSQKRFKELTEISSTFLSSKEQDLRRVSIVATILSRADSMEFKREAVKLFEHALNLSPSAVETKLNLASTLYQIGNAQRAKAIYQELLEQHPDNIRALNDLAWILQEHDHRYEAALELANKGLKIASDNLNLLDTRGTILLNMEGRLADARTDFEKLEQLSPPESLRQARTLLKLGRICARLDDNNRAKDYLEKALEIDSKLDVFNEEERSEIKGMLR